MVRRRCPPSSRRVTSGETSPRCWTSSRLSEGARKSFSLKVIPRTSPIHLIGFGLVLLILTYPLTFTTRPTAISGRETRVHLAAVVGAAMVAGGVAAGGLRWARRRFPAWVGAAVLAATLALLLGYGFQVQQDYVRAWELQRSFWRDLVPQIQDAGEGVVVMVDPAGLADTLQIGANTWNLPRVFLSSSTGCRRSGRFRHACFEGCRIGEST